MSDHKIPLTSLEHRGLTVHRLPIGTPSQLSDCFRHGMAWALRACDRPPKGWYCTREKDHEGPCAESKRLLAELQSQITELQAKAENLQKSMK